LKKKKFSKKIIVLAIIAIFIWSLNFYFLSLPKKSTIIIGENNTQTPTSTTTEAIKQRFISKECTSSSDCSWKITNCCTERTGGYWECINYKTFEPGCPDIVLCPQVLSPKPTTACVCEQGKCV